MDTTEARMRMLDLANRGLGLLEEFRSGDEASRSTIEQFRRIVDEARSLLSDAGYPAEGVWRGMQRVLSAMLSGVGRDDAEYWQDLANDFADARDSLDRLLSTPVGRETDFRIVG